MYPEYYLQPFHAYPKGNLDWLPAFEVESATMSMAVRTFPGTKPEAAQQRLRDNIHAAIKVLHSSSQCRACVVVDPALCAISGRLSDETRHSSSALVHVSLSKS